MRGGIVAVSKARSLLLLLAWLHPVILLFREERRIFVFSEGFYSEEWSLEEDGKEVSLTLKHFINGTRLEIRNKRLFLVFLSNEARPNGFKELFRTVFCSPTPVDAPICTWDYSVNPVDAGSAWRSSIRLDDSTGRREEEKRGRLFTIYSL